MDSLLKFDSQLYLFPIAAIINFHKISGLKQPKFIILFSVGQKSDVALTGLKSVCSQFLSGNFRENSLPLPFPGSRDHSSSLAHGPSSIFKAGSIRSLGFSLSDSDCLASFLQETF